MLLWNFIKLEEPTLKLAADNTAEYQKIQNGWNDLDVSRRITFEGQKRGRGDLYTLEFFLTQKRNNRKICTRSVSEIPGKQQPERKMSTGVCVSIQNEKKPQWRCTAKMRENTQV